MRYTTHLAAVLLLFLAAPLAAQTLTVKPDGGRFLGYVRADDPGTWAVFATGFLPVKPDVIDGGRCITWQGPAGEYGVVYFPADGEAVTARVVLGGAGPVPPPEPPGPIPPPLSQLAKQTRDWATTLVPLSAQLKCEPVAQSLDSVRAQMAAGTLKEPAKIVAATKEANQTAVGDLRDAWLPFFEVIRTYLNAEAAAKRLETVAQHEQVWADMAAGLRAVK